MTSASTLTALAVPPSGDSAQLALSAQVERAQRQGAWARAVPVAGALCAGGAVAVGLGASWLWAGPGLFALGLGAWRPSADAAAARLDAEARLDGALVCAWDHRLQTAPVVVAQRRRAVAALAGSEPAVRAWRTPSPLWALALGLWAWPLAERSPAPEPGDGPMAQTEAPPTTPGSALGAPTAPTTAMAPPTAPESHAAGLAPPAAVPDAGPIAAEDGGIQAGTRTGAGEGDGVGTRAGDQNGGGGAPVTVASNAAEPGEALPVPWMRTAGALGEAAGPRAAVAVPLGTPPDDGAVIDPARPFPPRYRGAVQRWFALRAGRTTAIHPGTAPAGRTEDP